MKRSVINTNIEWAMDLCKELHFNLPDFAYWTPEDWEAKKDITDRMRKVAMGWDVTDYASNDFDKRGAVLFTLRNGEMDDPGRPYCEKMIAMKDGQELPMHFHYDKTEDIINRAGGVLCIQVFNSTSKEDGYKLDTESDVTLYLDGVKKTMPAGTTIKVTNGNSVTLTPYVYHRFYAEGGPVIVGEVSKVNDDAKDNHFVEELVMTIEEDEPVRHNLCGGYVMK
ncbi:MULTISPECIES: D-lyxose/D-mannose family sugar isomerase [unclassified Candidatus Paralachnospira]|uniref:D-lyxose/D-mannose family sugar isomerase n=1 Tax=unclassified Candidatus Paralachnospira TaxID=3099471 RepID=UPI00303B637F